MVNLIRLDRVRGAFLLACVAALTMLWSCGGDSGGTDPVVQQTATTLTVTPATTTLTFIGATTTLIAKILDQNGSPMTGTVTWVSDAPDVATVSATGTVTAVDNGSTTVRASAGSLSASVEVTVQQVVTSLAVVGGNNQSAIAGEPLAEEVVVRTRDQGGTAVAGIAVTFTPDEGSGAVSVTSVTSDDDGMASTVWTMGSGFGPQRLTARVETGAAAVITARSRSPVPLPDLVTSGGLIVSRLDPTTLDTITVQVSIRNDGDASTGQAFRARVLSDGQEIASQEVAEMAPAGSETLVFEVGAFDVGPHTLTFEVDPDGDVEELIESNNGASGNISVVLQTPVQPGVRSALGAAENVELLYRLDLPGPANNLTVELTGGTGDVDLYIEEGFRPSSRESYNDCQSTSPTTVERCQIPNVTAGSYHILLHAFSTFSGTTMTISLDGAVLPFNIEVVFVDHGTAAQDAVFLEAAERWMSVLTLDIPDSDFSVQPVAAGDCLAGQPRVDGIVDDIRIYVSIDSIDGPSKVLAQAFPCVTRGLSNLPLLGVMEFDEADMGGLASVGELLPVVIHEMGHVLGIGTIWGVRGFLQNPSMPDNAGVDTYFNGAGARAAFNAAGGTSYTGGASVPVENTASEGSADAHWRESVLRRELMTPFFNSGEQNPLSAISVRSLEDLGYYVDVTKADAYSGSFSAPTPAPGIARRIIDLRGDVVKRPLIVVDQKGRLVIRER